MATPLVALLITAAIVLASSGLFWPKIGYFWGWRKMSRLTGRVLIEDALKHFYDAEYSHRPASVQSLAGALEISRNRAARVMAHIESLGLVERDGGRVRLTSGGRTYALRIIRVHRLWESYLSEKTGVQPPDWHDQAEEQEHWISADEANTLAAQIGYPRFDPHGDPIPTPSGDLPPRRGQPLTTLSEHESGVIVHLEDEPDEVYAQLVAERLHPGMQVQITEIAPDRVCFWADGDERVLAPVCAENISVLVQPQEPEMEGPFETLAALKPGEGATVRRIARTCRGLERRRLMDLGILPGTRIEFEMTSASGDPIAYRIRGALIALRKEQADHIQIDRQMEMA